MANSSDTAILKAREAAEIIGCSTDQIYNLKNKGKLKGPPGGGILRESAIAYRDERQILQAASTPRRKTKRRKLASVKIPATQSPQVHLPRAAFRGAPIVGLAILADGKTAPLYDFRTIAA